MERHQEVFILLRNKRGEKITDIPKISLTTACDVVRGELAKTIQKKHSEYDYQTVYSDHPSTFHDSEFESDVAPLLGKQALLLAGVKSKEERYHLFVADKLDWGESLKVNDAVLVSLNCPQVIATAVIQYVGPVRGEKGILFGVEIVEPHFYGKGTTDGVFQGERYFTCVDGNGMFVSLDKLSQLPPGRSTPKLPQSRPTAKPAAQPVSKRNYRFKVNDRVVAFTKFGDAVHGTVRWVGQYVMQNKTKTFEVAAVGIETNVKIRASDVESCLPIKHHYFTIGKDRSSLFLREEEVILESDFAGPQQPEPSQAPQQENQRELEEERRKFRDVQHRLQQEQQKSRYLELQLQQVEAQLQQEREQHRSLQARFQQEQQERWQEQTRRQQVEHELQQEQDRCRGLQFHLQWEQEMQPSVLLTGRFATAQRSEVVIEGVDPIGEGAWGKVERGRFRGSLVAVKSIHPAIFIGTTVERVRREITIMAQVHHPNLVRFVAAVLDGSEGTPTMILTELLDTNLRRAYQQKRVFPKHYMSILRDVAYGLHHLHNLQTPIIHRDISSPNVLLRQLPSGGWLAKISDFGSANFQKLAKTMGEGAAIYCAPEAAPPTVASDETEQPQTQKLTTKVDVFSYGKVACELVVERMPLPRDFRAMLREVEEKWVFMHGLIVRCTKRDPLERPTMADILNELPCPAIL